MTRYVEPGIETAASLVEEEILDGLAERLPGWVPSDAHVETALAGTLAPQIAENRELASEVLRSIFRYWASQFVGIPTVEASFAQGSSTWTVIDAAGYLVPAGALVTIRSDTGEEVAFAVREDVTIAPGATTTAAGGVLLDAEIEGAAGSGLAGTVRPVDSMPFVNTITLVGQTTGGVDAEDPDLYLDRASARLALLSDTPILPEDFAILARDVAGVGRSLALDGYNPANATSNNERMVTVALVDAAGAAVPTSVSALVKALLESRREVNFVVNVIGPTFATIAVAFTAVAYPGYDLAAVDLQAEAAVAEYLSPARWGARTLGDLVSGVPWSDEPVVRVSEVSAAINAVDGVHYVATLTLNGGTADVVMPGPAALASPGVISGSVTF
jgi:hypothetical protein